VVIQVRGAPGEQYRGRGRSQHNRDQDGCRCQGARSVARPLS
jgi:hypothetical protein